VQRTHTIERLGADAFVVVGEHLVPGEHRGAGYVRDDEGRLLRLEYRPARVLAVRRPPTGSGGLGRSSNAPARAGR
jgi:hypothetical protein